MSRKFELLQDIISPYAKIKLNNDFKYLYDQVNVQGQSISDLVASGQLTPYQYSKLITTVNSMPKSGEIDKFDFSNDLKDELENKADKRDISVSDINKNKGLLDGSFFTSQFIEELNGGKLNVTNVLQRSLVQDMYALKSVNGPIIDDQAISSQHLSNVLSKNFEGYRANFDAGVSKNRQMNAPALDVSNITIANVPINVQFTYYAPLDNIAKLYSFVWGESSGLTRLSETSILVDAEIEKIASFSYDITFTEERDLLTLFIRKTVPDESESDIYIKDIFITIDGVKYDLNNLNPYSSGGEIKNVRNLPPRLVTQEEMEIFFANADKGTVNKILEGKKWVTFGDSITWYDGNPFVESHNEYGEIAVGYQSHLKEHLGVNIVNKGGNGYRLADNILPVIKEYQGYMDVDFVSITSGANDFRANKPIGSIQPIGGTFDESTFYGALQSAVEFILNQNPYITIYLITPIAGWDDNKGKMPETYPQAFRDVAKLYGLPLCDWHFESTINDITKFVYIGDGEASGYDLHPTNAGYKRMGKVLVGTVKKHEGG